MNYCYTLSLSAAAAAAAVSQGLPIERAPVYEKKAWHGGDNGPESLIGEGEQRKPLNAARRTAGRMHKPLWSPRI